MAESIVFLKQPTITDKIFKNNSIFHGEIAHYGKSFISVFQEFSASINKTVILAGRLGTTILSSLDTFLIFPNFLRS